MKNQLLIVLLFFLAPVSYGAEITTTVSSTIEALNPSPGDTVYIASGDTVFIDDNWQANDQDTTCYRIDIQSGGVLEFTGGARANFGDVRIQNNGELRMVASDSMMLIANTDCFSAEGDYNEFYVYSGGRVYIDGGASNTRAVIMGADSGSPGILIDHATCDVSIQHAKIQKLKRGLWNAGLFFRTAQSTMDSLYLYDIIFDSCTVTSHYVFNFKMEACSLYAYRQYNNTAVSLRVGNYDTLLNCYINLDNESQSGYAGYGVTVDYSDSAFIINTPIICTNLVGSAGSGWGGVVLYNEAIGTHIINSTVIGWEFGITTSGSSGCPYTVIDGCYLQNCSHEAIILHRRDSNWTFQENLILDSSGGGRSAVTIYPSRDDADDSWDDSTLNNLTFLYNTIVSFTNGENPSTAPIAFENTNTGGTAHAMYFFNTTMVGNILLGAANSQDSSGIVVGTGATGVAHVDFEEFKNNSLSYNSDNSTGLKINSNSSAIFYDSSDNVRTTEIGFVDSLGPAHNYRLKFDASVSIRYGGDSAYWVQVFDPPDTETSWIGDIGYHQLVEFQSSGFDGDEHFRDTYMHMSGGGIGNNLGGTDYMYMGYNAPTQGFQNYIWFEIPNGYDSVGSCVLNMYVDIYPPFLSGYVDTADFFWCSRNVVAYEGNNTAGGTPEDGEMSGINYFDDDDGTDSAWTTTGGDFYGTDTVGSFHWQDGRGPGWDEVSFDIAQIDSLIAGQINNWGMIVTSRSSTGIPTLTVKTSEHATTSERPYIKFYGLGNRLPVEAEPAENNRRRRFIILGGQ